MCDTSLPSRTFMLCRDDRDVLCVTSTSCPKKPDDSIALDAARHKTFDVGEDRLEMGVYRVPADPPQACAQVG